MKTIIRLPPIDFPLLNQCIHVQGTSPAFDVKLISFKLSQNQLDQKLESLKINNPSTMKTFRRKLKFLFSSVSISFVS